jgi:mannonate dehydratase
MIRIAEILLDPQPTPAWRQLRQVGVDHAVGVLPRRLKDWRDDAGEHPWTLAPLAILHGMVEAEGFRLEVIEDNPPMDRIRLGRPGREEEIEQFCVLVRNMGRLDIPVLCYNWSALLGWVRTELAARGRAGAIVAGYDHERLAGSEVPGLDGVDDEALWDNLRFFLDRVIPVAEDAGVRLAMHPDDPPLSPVRGVPRIMRDVDAFERLLGLHSSVANGLTLCQGNFTLMTQDLPAVIRELGATGRIHFVHFRDVRGTPERFLETFHDEGPTDMLACMRAYAAAGVEAVMRTDHNPILEGDRADVPGYSNLGRLHAIGYVQGLQEAAYGDA